MTGRESRAVASQVKPANLDRLASDTGHFAILALDHVRSFATAVRPADPDSITPAFVRTAKASLIAGLGPRASAVLVDPGFWSGVEQEQRLLPEHVGVVLGLEDGDYEGAQVAPRLLPGWDVESAARLGVDAVKISFYFHPAGDFSVAEEFVSQVVAQCRAMEMPLFCEPLAIVENPQDRAGAVLEGVRRFGGLGVDVLKVQFPGEMSPQACPDDWVEACQEVDRLSPVPWTVLSEGSDFRLFRHLLGIACRAGASGFVAGRAVWREAAAGEVDWEFSADRLEDLQSIAVAEGRGWSDRMAGTSAGPELA